MKQTITYDHNTLEILAQRTEAPVATIALVLAQWNMLAEEVHTRAEAEHSEIVKEQMAKSKNPNGFREGDIVKFRHGAGMWRCSGVNPETRVPYHLTLIGGGVRRHKTIRRHDWLWALNTLILVEHAK